MRQALAGMMLTKQFYYYDVDKWLEERGADPFKPPAALPRNDHWHPRTMPTSSRCLTNGSIRGTRPGIWPSTSWR